jgi:hypothetical protein
MPTPFQMKNLIAGNGVFETLTHQLNLFVEGYQQIAEWHKRKNPYCTDCLYGKGSIHTVAFTHWTIDRRNRFL